MWINCSTIRYAIYRFSKYFYVWSLISIKTTIHFKYVFNTDQASTITNKPYTLTVLILITRCRQIYDTNAGVSQSQSSL